MSRRAPMVYECRFGCGATFYQIAARNHHESTCRNNPATWEDD